MITFLTFLTIYIFQDVTETVKLIDRYGVSIVLLVLCVACIGGIIHWMRKMIDKQNSMLFGYIEKRDKLTLEIFERNHTEIKEVLTDLKRVIENLPKRR